jgi:peroxiredoxin
MRNEPKIGDQAHTFELPDSTGKACTLADLLSADKVILTFFRGVW